MTSITVEATKATGAKPRDAERSKNFFALGLISLDVHPADRADPRLDRRAVRQERDGPRREPRRVQGRLPLRRDRRDLRDAVRGPARARCRRAGTATSRGNVALAYGLIAAGQQAKLPILYASYPITPGVRHPPRAVEAQELRCAHHAGRGRDRGDRRRDRRRVRRPARRHRHERSRASTSRPRRSGLAISLELPLVLVDVQRGGPSTGLPTKTEQADLLLAMYGRHGEAPLPIVAAKSPSHCFDAAFEGVRLALKYRTPVIVLTDGYLANGSEPWLFPDVDELPDISVPFTDRAEPPQRRRHHRVLAVRAGRDHAGPAVGHPGHARASCTASAASRSRTAPATSTTTRPTTSS